nr:MAG TPA: protein of unknown function (DUF5047) [Bacteriophage sp.]
MRRTYPYLNDSFYEDANSALKRRNFLKTIDNFVNQKQYVRLTLLNWNEEPLKEIQGVIASGSLSKDGSSSVRRTCSLTASINSGEYDIENMSYDFAINKKIFIEIGIENHSNQFLDYPILWFPQGVFFIASASASSSVSSAVSLQLTLKDKMCGLSGDVSGTLPAAVIFDEMDTQDASGAYVTKKVLVYDIIQELVNHYGGEDLNNIIIEDVPRRIKRVMKWTGSNPLYLVPKQSGSAGVVWYAAYIDKPETLEDGTIEILSGQDCGYVYDDFVYDSELSANLGESVTSVLDKIKSYLGNFEYFYDEFGVFHFREVKNYLNTTQATTLVNDMKKHDYLVETTTGKSVYTFSDKDNIISISKTPQFNNIKNDFIIQGKRQGTNSQQQVDVRYHLCIDRKPLPVSSDERGNNYYNTYYNLLLYTEESTQEIKAAFPTVYTTKNDFPSIGEFNTIYFDATNKFAYYWKDDTYKSLKCSAYYPAIDTLSVSAIAKTGSEETKEEAKPVPIPIVDGGYLVKDWRTELYLEGMLAKKNGIDSGNYYAKIDSIAGWQGDVLQYAHNCRIDTDYYFEELDAFWPQVYDLVDQKFIGEKENAELLTSSLTDGNYFLDFIDSSTSDLGQFSVSAIGRRTDAVSSDTVNCLFAPEIPNIVFINADEDDKGRTKQQECEDNGMPYTQVRGEVFYNLATGGYKNGAFDQVKYELYLHTTYQNSVSITGLPVFYLEPNSRIELNDTSTNTYGDYNLNTLSIPLGPGNAMTVSCNQSIERF